MRSNNLPVRDGVVVRLFLCVGCFDFLDMFLLIASVSSQCVCATGLLLYAVGWGVAMGGVFLQVRFRFLRRARPHRPPGRRQAHAPTNHAAGSSRDRRGGRDVSLPPSVPPPWSMTPRTTEEALNSCADTFGSKLPRPLRTKVAGEPPNQGLDREKSSIEVV